ncbi:hypothetical protein BS47DRAFT_677419 [Hydnum rufescens UP504]|uniref:DNA 3'-5' helicase n=1 Tax=Hydnum rufescens UP504 TaxID=1448309 RepID=A0A9P6B2T2_9AGAM|nr:hypothetical protein BS47DRAFT_677419 [Hydnum rufescens UP504]
MEEELYDELLLEDDVFGGRGDYSQLCFEDIGPPSSPSPPSRVYAQNFANESFPNHHISNSGESFYISYPPTMHRTPVDASSMQYRSSGSLPSYRNQEYDLPPVRHSYISQNTPALLTPISNAKSAADVRRNHSSFGSAQGVKLVPVSGLPGIYRGMFKFGVFNAMQSSCYQTVMHTNENMVISSPTGSGKTVIFELAIIKLLMESVSDLKTGPKCVYMAPTKALCTERFNDWNSKFLPVGIKCCQLTGDTALTGKDAWNEAKNSTIIITTPEKWDSLTRNWQDNGDFLSHMTLFLVDEVHILHESRGATLEVCISRMKTRAHPRFVLLSATVPNIEDIASWIRHGDPPDSTQVFKFDESFRACRITRHVYGYPRKQQNEFQFLSTLDGHLFSVLQKHVQSKPVVIFCPTRKSVTTTAEKIATSYMKLTEQKQNLPWRLPPRIDVTFQDVKLQAVVKSGVAIHHAGLNLDDRKAVEELFAKKKINVIVSTSTLAVGVNMPAHTVVIHGTKQWAGSWVEYNDLDIIQMIGRAGRPQFDKEGVAIILCESTLEAKYNSLISGQTILESCLHQNLIEHFTSEICLGTISDIRTAKTWLRNSFLFQRLQRNPSHYSSLGDKTMEETWQERLDQLVTNSILTLNKAELISMQDNSRIDDASSFSITDYGEIMTRYYIRFSTMRMIKALPEDAGLKSLLETICQSEEITDGLRLRAEEKKAYNDLRNENDIRFQTKKVEKTCDKVFILVQAVLGGISLSSKEWKGLGSQPHLDSTVVFRHAVRIAKAIVDAGLVRRCGSHVKYGMELVRSLTARAWEDRPVVLKQIPQIGDKSYKAGPSLYMPPYRSETFLQVLAENDIATIAVLRLQKPHRIEALLNRKPPFGRDIISIVQDFPDYILGIDEEAVTSDGGRNPVVATINISISLQPIASPSAGSKKKKRKGLGMTSILVLTSDSHFEDFRRIPQVPFFFSCRRSLLFFTERSPSSLPRCSPSRYPLLNRVKVSSSMSTQIISQG